MTELTQIKPITANEAELKQLAQDYGNLVVTTQNLDAADKARLRLKNERITIQRQEKANNDVLKQIKKDNENRAELLIGIIKPVEDKLDLAITAIKEAEAKKKEQEKLKEQNRVQGHRNRITGIAQSTARLALATNVEDIKVKIAETNALKGGFEEFEQEAAEAIELFCLSAENRVKQLEQEEKAKTHVEGGKDLFDKQNHIISVTRSETTQTPTITTKKVDLEWEGERVVAKESPDGKYNVAVIGERQEQLKNMNTAQAEQVSINFSTMGYDFHIPVTIPQQYQDKIKSAIEAVLGEMPLV
jgi:hypothetical protein